MTKIKEVNPEKEKIGEVETIAQFRPSAFVGRIIGQWGRFTYHPNPKIPLDNSLGKMKIEKIIVPSANREEILFDLNFYGFNDTTLFPDVEGLSRHLNWWSSNENWKKDLHLS